MGLLIFEYAGRGLARLLKNKGQAAFLAAAAVLTVISGTATVLHYAKIAYGNIFTWLGWLLSMAFWIVGFGFQKIARIRNYSVKMILEAVKRKFKKNFATIRIVFYLVVIFIFVNLFNWQTAPWNENGVFDDAAWDIYFSKIFITDHYPFQGAWWQRDDSTDRDEPMSAAKEILYHYYITLCFNLFGYNLLVFNLAGLFLTLMAFLFTVFLLQSLFKNHFITFFCGILLCFLPIFFIHGHVNHRYILAPPLIMAALFFLHKGTENSNRTAMALSGILAGLCFTSAIMGKQLIYAIVGAAALAVIFGFKRTVTKANFKLALSFLLPLLAACIPMLGYIIFSPQYFSLEGGYLELFFAKLKIGDFAGFKVDYIDRMVDCLFGVSWNKWFMPDLPIVPYLYYLFIFPGLFIAMARRKFIWFTMAGLPFLASFLAGFTDYRIVIASPIWIICMGYSFDFILTRINPSLPKIGKTDPAKLLKAGKTGLIVVICGIEVVLSALYFLEKSSSPNSMYFFAQNEVAVARYLRDVATGNPSPSTAFRPDEFRKPKDFVEPPFDTLIAMDRGYAIPHTYFQDYHGYEVFSFMGQLPFNLYPQEELLKLNRDAILSHHTPNKALKMIWEESTLSDRVVNAFRSLESYGQGEHFTISHDSDKFVFYSLTVSSENLADFKREVRKLKF